MNKKTNYTIKNHIPRWHLGKHAPLTSVPRWHLGNRQGLWWWTWVWLGRAIYFVTWPGIWLVVRFTPPRTRIIIEYKNEILLTKDWLGSGQWSLPGGGLHRKEDKTDGALRELLEETGVAVKSNDLIYIKTISLKKYMPTTLHFFNIKLNDKPDVKIQKFEILEYRWVRTEQISSVNLHPACTEVVSALYEV